LGNDGYSNQEETISRTDKLDSSFVPTPLDNAPSTVQGFQIVL